MILLDGTQLAKKNFLKLKTHLALCKKKPKLAGILVGDKPASHIYINKKKQACKDLQLECDIFFLDKTSSQQQVKELIKKLNQDPSVSGILLQLPLPKHLKPLDLINSILPEKDVDGLNSKNMGLLLQKSNFIVPCTAKGIYSLLKHYDIKIKNSSVTIIGRSLIVGLPLSILLQQQGATVSLCHSQTLDIKSFTMSADIVIVAVGKKHFLNKSYFKKDATVIDVGINHENKKLYGDVCPRDLDKHLKAYSPVPGGVGPMTIQSLMENLIFLSNL